MKLSALWVTWIIASLLAGCSWSSTPGYTPAGDTQSSEPAQAPSTPQLIEITEIPDLTQVTSTTEILTPTGPTVPNAAIIPCSGTLTSYNMEGPYYTPNSPERNTLIENSMPGVPILITGQVFNQNCSPIVGAKVDFWQADANGVYDNSGFTLRGHVITDQTGSYSMETIEPGLYTGRPAHIHVKVFAPDGRELLTTQLYFPGSEDAPDVQAAPDLLVNYRGLDAKGRQQIIFNFIVQD